MSGASEPTDESAHAGAGTVRVVPLGGLGEVGMNCLAIEDERGIVIVDCGVTFPSIDQGVDVLHPRFDWLVERASRVRGVVLTHGHEDHIGAVPFLLDALGDEGVDVPVFGPAHALELARGRLSERGFREADVDLRPTRAGVPFSVGGIEVEPIAVTHSIADATGLALRTRAGLIVHTGDFKLDKAPLDGRPTDEARFRELGDEGVHLLLSDSTNVDSPGWSESESTVAARLASLVEGAPGRVIVGLFASNVHRLRALFDVARSTGRKVTLLGRSMSTHTRAAETVGLLAPTSDVLVSVEQAARLPPHQVLALATGTQAEPRSALARLAAARHPVLRIESGDLVVMSSRVIPGHELAAVELEAGLLRQGARVVTRLCDPAVHASGHAHRLEQARMLELVRPRSFVPIHGTLHHLVRHAELARDEGVDDALVCENGDVIALEAGQRLRKVDWATTGRVAVAFGEELSEEVLRDRGRLGRAGLVVACVVLDDGGALRAVRATSRGVVAPTELDVLREAERAAARAVRSLGARAPEEAVREASRLAARRAIEERTGQRPEVVVLVARVDA